MPLLAVNILPLGFRKELGSNFGNNHCFIFRVKKTKIYPISVLHPWNLYLFICSLVPLTSAVAFLFLPESPKFLMSTGKNEEALLVFRKMYSMNTGLNADTFPVSLFVTFLT